MRQVKSEEELPCTPRCTASAPENIPKQKGFGCAETEECVWVQKFAPCRSVLSVLDQSQHRLNSRRLT
jgi:hypothetical protein